MTFTPLETAPVDDPKTTWNEALYDYSVVVTWTENGKEVSREFRGTTAPHKSDYDGQPKAQHARLKPGEYNIQLGFHNRTATPKADDLTVWKEPNAKNRPALIVERDGPVPVTRQQGPPTATEIHVHNGFNTDTYSIGCPTIAPGDWQSFIGTFKGRYPSFECWSSTASPFVGVDIGTLVIK